MPDRPITPQEPLPPPASGGRRTLWLLLALFGALVGATVVEMIFFGGGRQALGRNLLVLTLLNVNGLLLLVLGLLIGRHLYKLYLERKLPGGRFRSRLVLTFVGLTLIPSILLFVIASGLLTQTFNTWFRHQVETPLQDSLELARTFYQGLERQALHYAQQIGQRLPDAPHQAAQPLESFLAQKREEYGVGMVEVYTPRGRLVARSIGRDLPLPLREPTDLLDRIRRDERATAVQSLPDAGEWILGGVAYRDAQGSMAGVVLVSYFLSPAFAGRATVIAEAFEESQQLHVFKGPIKWTYLLTFLLVTLIVLFASIWAGLQLAKGITVPIQHLAVATQAVAEGHLDHRIPIQPPDELGMLVDSFNRMTADLESSKAQIEETHRSLLASHRELEQRQVYMGAVLAHIGTGVISLDTRGRVATINRAAGAILELDAAAALDRPYREILAGPSFAEIAALIHKMEEGGSATRREVQVPFPGRSVILRLHLSPLQDSGGAPLGCLLVFDDLTDLLQAQKMAAWKEVAQRIAHEIKNPLTPIQLSAQRLRKRFQEGGTALRRIAEEATETIIHQVESLKHLVDEFTRFARMPEAHLLPGDLRQILAEVAHLYAGAHKEIAVLTDFADDLPPVLLDREQIRRVLINLFDNAVEAMERRGRIWVSARYDGRHQRVRAEVADEGCGIAPEDQDKLFLPYFSRKRSGTGLGLAIAKRIVTDHHGLLEAKPNTPRGTRFIIELPAPASPPPAAAPTGVGDRAGAGRQAA